MIIIHNIIKNETYENFNKLKRFCVSQKNCKNIAYYAKIRNKNLKSKCFV